MRRSMLIVSLVIALVPTSVAADSTGDIEELAPGEDDNLYSCEKAKRKTFVNLKPDTQLEDLVQWAMTFSCKNFVFASSIGKRSAAVTLIAPGKLTPRQAWRAFLVALQSAGLTVVPKGELLEVVESSQANGKPLPVYTRDRVSATDQVVRMVLRPEHVSAQELSEALSTIKTAHGTVTALPKAALIIITDYGTSIDRMLDLAREVDQATHTDHIYVAKVQHADAAEVASTLEQLFRPDGKDAKAPLKIIPEVRSNSLILVCDEAMYQRVRRLLSYVDPPLPGGDGGMYVYHLENADAVKLAATLSASLAGGAAPRAPTAARTSNKSRPKAAPIAAAKGVAFEGEVRVTADAETNALVVNASARDFTALRLVIRELDQPRRQVYIEATIVELQVGGSSKLGATLHAGDVRTIGGRESLTFAGVQHPGFSSLALDETLADNGSGVIAGAVGPKLPGVEELLGVSIPSFTVLVQALATRGHLDLVSQPHITATDNIEASIAVGQNIPYQAERTGFSLGTSADGGTVPTGFSVQRQRVGLTLKIKPHINESDMIRLEIDQELQDIAAPINDLGPTWSERKLTTTVVVRDQQSIVIGGLMQEKEFSEQTKVPLLGDIPILGWVFRRNTTEKRKTNLMIVLTPYIIKDDLDLQRILERKSREREEFAATLDNFDAKPYAPDIDYRRRRGVVEEINRSVRLIERERALREELAQRVEEAPEGRVE